MKLSATAKKIQRVFVLLEKVKRLETFDCFHIFFWKSSLIMFKVQTSISKSASDEFPFTTWYFSGFEKFYQFQANQNSWYQVLLNVALLIRGFCKRNCFSWKHKTISLFGTHSNSLIYRCDGATQTLKTPTRFRSTRNFLFCFVVNRTFCKSSCVSFNFLFLFPHFFM